MNIILIIILITILMILSWAIFSNKTDTSIAIKPEPEKPLTEEPEKILRRRSADREIEKEFPAGKISPDSSIETSHDRDEVSGQIQLPFPTSEIIPDGSRFKLYKRALINSEIYARRGDIETAVSLFKGVKDRILDSDIRSKIESNINYLNHYRQRRDEDFKKRVDSAYSGQQPSELRLKIDGPVPQTINIGLPEKSIINTDEIIQKLSEQISRELGTIKNEIETLKSRPEERFNLDNYAEFSNLQHKFNTLKERFDEVTNDRINTLNEINKFHRLNAEELEKNRESDHTPETRQILKEIKKEIDNLSDLRHSLNSLHNKIEDMSNFNIPESKTQPTIIQAKYDSPIPIHFDPKPVLELLDRINQQKKEEKPETPPPKPEKSFFKEPEPFEEVKTDELTYDELDEIHEEIPIDDEIHEEELIFDVPAQEEMPGTEIVEDIPEKEAPAENVTIDDFTYDELDEIREEIPIDDEIHEEELIFDVPVQEEMPEAEIIEDIPDEETPAENVTIDDLTYEELDDIHEEFPSEEVPESAEELFPIEKIPIEETAEVDEEPEKGAEDLTVNADLTDDDISIDDLTTLEAEELINEISPETEDHIVPEAPLFEEPVETAENENYPDIEHEIESEDDLINDLSDDEINKFSREDEAGIPETITEPKKPVPEEKTKDKTTADEILKTEKEKEIEKHTDAEEDPNDFDLLSDIGKIKDDSTLTDEDIFEKILKDDKNKNDDSAFEILGDMHKDDQEISFNDSILDGKMKAEQDFYKKFIKADRIKKKELPILKVSYDFKKLPDQFSLSREKNILEYSFYKYKPMLQKADEYIKHRHVKDAINYYKVVLDQNIPIEFKAMIKKNIRDLTEYLEKYLSSD